jgi:HEAT repeat protein
MTLLNVATIVLILACLTVSFSGIEGFTQEHPQKPIRHSLLVRDLAASGQTEKALKAYYQFHKLGGTFSEELLLEIVRGALNHSDISAQHTAAFALGELGDTSAIPALINALNNDDIALLQIAAEALAKLGDKSAIPALKNALYDDDGGVRFYVTEALAKLGDKSAIPALKNALYDDDSMIRMYIGRIVVAKALAELGDKSAIPVLHKGSKQ